MLDRWVGKKSVKYTQPPPSVWVWNFNPLEIGTHYFLKRTDVNRQQSTSSKNFIILRFWNYSFFLFYFTLYYPIDYRYIKYCFSIYFEFYTHLEELGFY